MAAPADPGRERLDVPHRARWVAKSERQEPGPGGLWRQSHFLRGQLRGSGEERSVEEPLVDAAHLTSARLPVIDDLLLGVRAMAHQPAEAAQVGR